MNIKRNDLLPPLDAVLLRTDGAPIDLTGCTVRLRLRSERDLPLKVDAPATIVDAPGGVVRYEWLAGDTDTVDVYRAEFEITFPSTKTMTVPTDSFFSVHVIGTLT